MRICAIYLTICLSVDVTTTKPIALIPLQYCSNYEHDEAYGENLPLPNHDKTPMQYENREQCDGLELSYVAQSMGIAYIHVDYVHTTDIIQNII